MSRQSVAGRDADVGAVEVGPDARGQVGDHVFAQAGISARRTDLSALEAGGDAALELVPVDAAEVSRVGLQHLCSGGHVTPLARKQGSTRAVSRHAVLAGSDPNP